METERKGNPSIEPVPGAVPVQENYSFIWGIIGFLIALLLMRGRGIPPCLAGAGALAATALPMALLHWLRFRVHRHASTGLDFSRPVAAWNFPRTLVKYLGLVVTLGVIGFLYWLLPEYHSKYYLTLHQVGVFLPWFVLAAFPYFLWVDSRMTEPEDEYWHMGCLALGRWRRVDFQRLRAHAMGWLVKAFFLPLMFIWVSDDIRGLLLRDFRPFTFLQFHTLALDLLSVLDVLFACLGYLLTVRVLDAHIRSTEPTLLGWAVALVCYEPFWGFAEPHYFNYYGTIRWDTWLNDLPWLRVPWGLAILGLMGVYTWATLAFGFRFSNLTHRGILTHGPYRFLKHPAYLSKNLAWWLIDLPFLSSAGLAGTIRQCLLLLALNGIYYLRAKTEERHLARDPVYQAYCRHMDEFGLWAQVRKRAWPFFRSMVASFWSRMKTVPGWLVAVVGAGLLTRVIICFHFNPLDTLYSDATRHWLNGQQFLHPNLMSCCDAIGYQAYIFLLRLVTQDDRYLVALLCGILSILLPWSYYRAGREFGLSRLRALLLCGLVAWLPSLVFIYHFIMTETLLLTLMGVSLWMSGRYLRKGSLRSGLVATAMWTLTCLTKIIPFPLAIVFLGYGWWRHSRKVSHLLAAAALAVVLVVPSAIRSYRTLGFVAPFGNPWLQKIHHHAGTKNIRVESGEHYWSYGSPSAHIQPLAPLSAWTIHRSREDTEIRLVIDPANGEQDWAQAHARLPNTWQDRLERQAENAVLLLFAQAWPESNRPGWEGWVNRCQRWLWAPLTLVMLAVNLKLFMARRFDLIPVATTIFALGLLLQDVATMEGRFRKPLEPMLLFNLVWVLRPPGVVENRKNR
jgi:hypothetical protein